MTPEQAREELKTITDRTFCVHKNMWHYTHYLNPEEGDQIFYSIWIDEPGKEKGSLYYADDETLEGAMSAVRKAYGRDPVETAAKALVDEMGRNAAVSLSETWDRR